MDTNTNATPTPKPRAPRRSQQKRFLAALSELKEYSTGQRIPTYLHRNDYAHRFQRTKWWRKHLWYLPHRLCWPASTELTILHEMSLYIGPKAWGWRPRATGESWYRREQAAAFVMLVQHQLGREAAKKLRAAYRKHGVKYYPPRRKPGAPVSPQAVRLSVEAQAKLRAEIARLIAGL